MSLLTHHPATETNKPSSFKLIRFAEVPASAESELRWLWNGYLASRNVTLLTSQWKVGKTTLLALLLAKMESGGALAGQEVAPGKALVISEELPSQWRIRAQRIGMGLNVTGFCRPFVGKPTQEQWVELVDRLEELRVEEEFRLVVIDSLAFFSPEGSENHGDGMLRMLRALERLTAADVAVLILHHPRKGATLTGQAARGAGAISAYCDILIEMQGIPGPGQNERRRRLLAWSRHEETPHDVTIELSADGREYYECPSTQEDEVQQAISTVVDILKSVGQPLSRRQIQERWPGLDRPDQTTLWRWLERGVQRGQFKSAVTGGKGSPLIYSLPGVDAPWRPDILDMFEMDGYTDNLLKSALGTLDPQIEEIVKKVVDKVPQK